MNMFKLQSVWLHLAAIVMLAVTAPPSHAEEMPVAGTQASVSVYLFWVHGCPHCAREIKYLQGLSQELPAVDLKLFEITSAGEGRRVFLEVVRVLGISEPSVPLTVIGNHVWMGFAADSSSSRQMRERIDFCLQAACPDALAPLLPSTATSSAADVAAADGRGMAGQGSGTAAQAGSAVMAPVPERMQLPLIGEINPRDLSLPVLTVLLGALDGFNPCAMWTLVFLIGLLVGMKDTTRMWILGSTFIIGSATVYFIFMAAWLNLLLFLGSVSAIRIVIGLVALTGGFYYLKEYFQNVGSVCSSACVRWRRSAISCWP
jgi:glutaredoxin